MSQGEDGQGTGRQKTKEDRLKYWAECKRKYSRTPRGRFSHARKMAKKRGLAFTLSQAEFTEYLTKPCFYCGLSSGTTGSGLDRIDNARGYETGNVLPCCGTCNRVRSNQFTVKETYVMVQSLLTYRRTIGITS